MAVWDNHAVMLRSRWFVPFLLLATLLAPRGGRGESAAIFLDGTFADWTGPIEHVDPAGDGGAGADFRDVDLANDANWLFVRFQTTLDVGLQATNNLYLYLDTDMNAGTGGAIGGIGAELQWSFGTRTGCFQPPGSGTCAAIGQNAIRLRMLPSITSNTFEIAIARNALPNGNPLFTGSSFRLLLRDFAGGDLAPNAGGLAYTFDAGPVPPPPVLPFAREDPLDVRVVTWNVVSLQSGTGFNPAVTPAADRVLSAMAPDIICFQEIYTPTAAAVQALVEGMLPERAPWYATKVNDCVIVSRYPVLQSWALDGNVAALLDADAALDTDLLLVCAHLPCCANDTPRQAEADRIMSFFRDAMSPGGVVTVPTGTALVLTGDLNLVGFAQQLRTLLEGDIVNNATFGPDFAPDWDGGPLSDVISSQTEQRFAYTWRDDPNTFAPGRLDFVIFNDSVLELRRHLILYSPEMSPAQQFATGILAADVTTVSDHLPHLADFRSVSDLTAVGPSDAGHLALRGPGVGRGAVRFTLEVGAECAVTLDVFDVGGRLVRMLRDPGSGVLGAGSHPIVWDGRSDGGAAAGSGAYFLRVIARPTTGGPTRSATGRCVLLR